MPSARNTSAQPFSASTPPPQQQQQQQQQQQPTVVTTYASLPSTTPLASSRSSITEQPQPRPHVMDPSLYTDPGEPLLSWPPVKRASAGGGTRDASRSRRERSSSHHRGAPAETPEPEGSLLGHSLAPSSVDDITSPGPEELADATAGMTHDELREAVEDLLNTNRVLHTSIEREREALRALQQGLSKSYMAVEREQENATNQLMRRVDDARRRKDQYKRKLAELERSRESRRHKLHATVAAIDKLTTHLAEEEREISSRMAERLERVKEQRRSLEAAREQQSYSVVELERLVNELQAEGAAAAAGSEGSLSRSRRASALLSQAPPSAAAAAAASASAHTHTDTNNSSPVVNPQPSERSVSQMSTSSATCAAAAAADPGAMLRFLEEEITVVETFRKESAELAEEYERRNETLAREVERERVAKRAHQAALTQAQSELATAASAVNEMRSAQEMAFELGTDRLVLRATPSLNSSQCMTPKHTASARPSVTHVGGGSSGGGAAARPLDSASTPNASSSLENSQNRPVPPMTVQDTTRFSPPKLVPSSQETSPQRYAMPPVLGETMPVLSLSSNTATESDTPK